MKHFVIGIFSILTFTAYGQGISPTTDIEYAYATEGYRHTMEKGLDIKKGYTVKEIMKEVVSSRHVKFLGLYRDGENKPCATIIHYSRPSTTYVEYICVPTYDASEVMWSKTFKKFGSYGSDALRAVTISSLRLATLNNQ